MPPDFGLYSAITGGGADFDQMRKDAMQNLVISQQMRNDAIAQQQEKMKVMGAISKELNTSAEIAAEFQGPDKQRFVDREEAIRKKNIISTLQENNNDLLMFSWSGGDAALDKYHRELIGSEEFRNGKDNSANIKLGAAATMKGEMLRPVDVTYPGGTVQKKVPWHDAFDLWQQGVIKKLPFNGSVPMGEVDPLKFLAIERPAAENKWGGHVSVEFLAHDLLSLYPNYTPEDAMEQAKLHEDPKHPGRTHLLWGNVIPRGGGGGGGDFWNKQALQQANVLARYQYLKQSLKDPALARNIIMNQPYKGGFISGYNIVPKGTLTQQGNKLIPTTEDVATITVTLKDKHGYYEEQETMPLNQSNGYGLQFLNRLANINREGTQQFVDPEPFNQIYQSDPDFFPGAGGTGTKYYQNGVEVDVSGLKPETIKALIASGQLQSK